MNLSEFLAFAATRRPLDTEEIGRFMDEMSDSAPVSYTHLWQILLFGGEMF